MPISRLLSNEIIANKWELARIAYAEEEKVSLTFRLFHKFYDSPLRGACSRPYYGEPEKSIPRIE